MGAPKIITGNGHPVAVAVLPEESILWGGSSYSTIGLNPPTLLQGKSIRKPRNSVPKTILRTCEHISEQGKISISKQKSKYDSLIFTSLDFPYVSIFDKDHIGVLNSLIDEICNGCSAYEISRVSQDNIWKAFTEGPSSTPKCNTAPCLSMKA